MENTQGFSLPQRYRNLKTEKIYILLMIAKHTENEKEMAIYTDGSQVWCSLLDRFLDRFVPSR
jgi:hypothetical protein